MTIPGISIRNPVMATMLALLIVAAGIIAYLFIPLQDQPNVTFPAITVTTLLPGGNANSINQTVTKPIEKELNTLPRVQSISAYSEAGKSSVTVHFLLGTDMNASYNRLENKLNHIRSQLPHDTRPSLIALATNENDPVIMYSLFGSQSLEELNHFARKSIEPKLQNIEGVGKIMITGASDEAVSINLDLVKMAALKMTPTQIQRAFQQAHVDIPGGVVTSGKKQFTLNLDLAYKKIGDLKNIVVGYRKKAPIFLHDVATVTFGFEKKGSNAFFNAHQSIGINVVRQLGANTVGVISAVQKRMQEAVAPNLPNGMTLKVVYSQSNFIMRIVHGLERDVWLAVLTAGFVIFLFLRSFRPTAIIVIVIPISLFGAIATIYLSNYTLNAITLLSLSVLVGIVVDDSIVVLENIYRTESLHKNLSPEQSAIVGADQVALPITACSLSLVSIFLPIVFMGGVLSLLFKPFAIVVTAGVLFSLLMSLTFCPVLCSRMLKQKQKENKLSLFLKNAYQGLHNLYAPVLRFMLGHRWIAVLIVIVLFGLCIPAFQMVNKTFMPATTNTGYFTVAVQAPEGMSTEYTKTRVKEAEKLIATYADVGHIFSSTGPTANQGSISVQLVAQAKRSITQKAFMSDLRIKLKNIPGALFFVETPNHASQITYQIRGPNFNKVINLSYKLLSAVEKHPDLGESYIYLASNQPQFQVFMDRVLANSLGVTSRDVANILSIMSTDGMRIGHFSQGTTGERYKVIIRPQEGQFTSADDLSNVFAQTPHGKPVRLDTIVSLEKSLMPSKITRTNLLYSVGFASLATISTNKAITEVQKLAKPILPKGYDLKLTGNTASLGNTVSNVEVTFLLILALIYMVLASQFNSFLQPFIVMVMQPLAIAAALFTLVFTSESVNVYSMIAMLLLVGLTTKNTIMLVSLTNNLVRTGTKVYDALMEVAQERFRPVVMTALALIMAQTPAIFATDNTYRSLSMVILGGIAFTAVLSVIIIPCFYSLFAQFAPPRPKVTVPTIADTDRKF
jgi:HAE1 family hydrophobic/amphiphilic exporter-1